ncbi:MAG: MBL fold metallo-hydrolase [Ignavibacteria bacterium]|nr:MBL fold metallo-hydrolase [Ignavibacteria bacterium]
MKEISILFILFLVTITIDAQNTFEKDTINTEKGKLVITFIGHGTLIIEAENKTIHIDPVGMYADYSKMPKADLILITHHHGDHFDTAAINNILKNGTRVIGTKICSVNYPNISVLENGDIEIFSDFLIEAVPAYNIVHKRDDGNYFHPKGEGNGYVINVSGKRIYIAGDTENVPEMKNLNNIDIAFLPMNLPYTMSPEMVANAVELFNPKILYPYHFGKTDVNILIDLLKSKNECEVRIRKME